MTTTLVVEGRLRPETLDRVLQHFRTVNGCGPDVFIPAPGRSEMGVAAAIPVQRLED
jgi:hypothetical protein